jgi:DNA-binding PadR family transcriptional regulator
MRSPVNWALLGLLIERPGYGYDLYQRFKRTYGKTIELSCQAQIYKGLDALEERGLIEPLPSEVAVPEEQRQPKTRYRARPEAVPDYRDWLIAQVTQERQRLELVALQVGTLPAREALAVVDRYERHVLSQRGSAASTLDGSSALARGLGEHARQLETGLALRWTAYARRQLDEAIEAQTVAAAGRAGPVGDRVALR